MVELRQIAGPRLTSRPKPPPQASPALLACGLIGCLTERLCVALGYK